MLDAERTSSVQSSSPLASELPRFLHRLRTMSDLYRSKLADVDIDAVVDLDRFREAVPLMSKADTLADQRAAPPFGTILSVDPVDVRQVHLTSGTTGFGQEAFALAADDVDAIGDAWSPLFDRAGLRPGDSAVVLYPVTFLAVSRSLLEAGRRLDVVMLPLSGVDRSIVAKVIDRLRPAAIIGRAAAVTLVADAYESEFGDASSSSIRAVLSAGLGPGQSAALEKRFGAAIFEYYGCSQIGTVAGGTCNDHGTNVPVIHLEHERWLFEVLDPATGSPVGDGEEGELVVTTPRRVASPLLRFRMGDRVLLRADCPCGRGWGIEVGSVGRYDDMVKIRGNNVWPTQVDEAVLLHPAVRDYRAAKTVDPRGIDGLAIVVATGASEPDRSAILAGLRTSVKRHTNVTPMVRFVDALPDPGLKPRRWVSETELEGMQ
jgi:phenylacetate-CoA ligase